MSTLHVVFRVGDADYVLPATEVLHIDVFEGATPVPGTAPWVLGLVQVRRRVVPVIDLRARFGLPALAPSLQSRVIVVQVKDRLVGLSVDQSREVVHLAPEEFKPPPELLVEQSHELVKAVAQAKNRLLMLVDVDRVIGHAQLGPTDQELAHGN